MAEEMSKYDKFFMPYEFDFRGRAYAKPLLNPQKDDLNKGLLLLANKKPIGERGLYWLKFIVATLGEQDGIDKKHPDERVKWTEEHLPEIEAIAYNPLDCLEMWAQGDNRFQYYAACKELVNALTNPEGAEAYCSGFPIGFDGACSGMQHYSAMTLDEKSGRLVNLCDAERQDLYGYVANKVLEDINQLITEAKPNRIIIPRHKSGSEVIEEMEIEEASMAQHWLDSGLIGRSLVKA
ncbi:DNA-directed RNA polymerase, partial [Herbiconiux daphne]